MSGECEAGPGWEVCGCGRVEGVCVEDSIKMCERRVGVCGNERDSERALTTSSNITTSTPLPPPTHTPELPHLQHLAGRPHEAGGAGDSTGAD